VLSLLQAAVGWVPDEQYARFFEWKHAENPFGASPAWVALDGDRLVGFRTFLRWGFTWGERSVKGVRAVDTATHPDYQGRGVFSRLTRMALEELMSEGVDFVFNTPNEKSRPGYLKMGWHVVGRLPVLARPRSIGRLGRLAHSRVAADKWSVPSTTGVAATTVPWTVCWRRSLPRVASAPAEAPSFSPGATASPRSTTVPCSAVARSRMGLPSFGCAGGAGRPRPPSVRSSLLTRTGAGSARCS
jgi:GNAT superfamily N-acetyltransferase